MAGGQGIERVGPFCGHVSSVLSGIALLAERECRGRCKHLVYSHGIFTRSFLGYSLWFANRPTRFHYNNRSDVDAESGSGPYATRGRIIPMPDDPFATLSSDQPVLSQDPYQSVSIPKYIGRFRIEQILGQGGFGVVYLGLDEQLQRKVAIKVPKAQFVQRTEDRERYLKEARTVAGLEHPNLVPVHEVGSTPDFPIYIVSKFIVGKDLAAHLKSATPTNHQTVQWMIDLADALREAHRKGFVHRDVKPQNILVDQDERVFLVDFGLALADQDVGKRLPAGGTPAYMSPEQARGEGHRVDGRSDLFSLGILFYEMLCGRRPFHGNSQLELFEQIKI